MANKGHLPKDLTFPRKLSPKQNLLIACWVDVNIVNETQLRNAIADFPVKKFLNSTDEVLLDILYNKMIEFKAFLLFDEAYHVIGLRPSKLFFIRLRVKDNFTSIVENVISLNLLKLANLFLGKDLNRDLSSIYGIRPKNNRASNNINASFQKVTPASAEKQDIDVDDDKVKVALLMRDKLIHRKMFQTLKVLVSTQPRIKFFLESSSINISVPIFVNLVYSDPKFWYKAIFRSGNLNLAYSLVKYRRHKLSLVADLIDEEKYWPVLVKMASHSIYDKDSFTRILDYTHTRPQMYIVHLIVMAQRPWAFEVYLEKYTVIFVELLRFNLMKAEKLIQKRHEENIIQLNQIQDLAFVLEVSHTFSLLHEIVNDLSQENIFESHFNSHSIKRLDALLQNYWTGKNMKRPFINVKDICIPCLEAEKSKTLRSEEDQYEESSVVPDKFHEILNMKVNKSKTSTKYYSIDSNSDYYSALSSFE